MQFGGRGLMSPQPNSDSDKVYRIPRRAGITAGVASVYRICVPSNLPDGVGLSTAASMVEEVCGESGSADGTAELTAGEWNALLEMVDHCREIEREGLTYRSDDVVWLRQELVSTLSTEPAPGQE